MTVRHQVFESSTQSWESLCDDVAEFASQIGKENLISISVAASGGTNILGAGGNGVIVVWYWE